MTSLMRNRRPPHGWELAILRCLLERSFPGRDELLQQAEQAEAFSREFYGSLIIHFSLPEGVKRAGVLQRTPLEAEYIANDADGVDIHLVLHVKDGLLHEIELFREDSLSIIELPKPEQLVPAY